MNGTWTTTGGKITVSAGGVVALFGGGYLLTHKHQAGEAVSGAVVSVAVVLGAVLVAAIAYAVVRVRGHRRNRVAVYGAQAARAGIQWQANPNALPLRETRAITAPVQPVINNFFGADATAAYFREQAAPVYRVTAESVEEQQEIPR